MSKPRTSASQGGSGYRRDKKLSVTVAEHRPEDVSVTIWEERRAPKKGVRSAQRKDWK